MKPIDTFLSHADEDEKIARKLADELKNFSLLQNEELIQYFKNTIFFLPQFSARENIVPILEKEIKEKGELMENATMIENPRHEVFRIMGKMSDDEIMRELIMKIEHMEFDELRLLIKENVDRIQPSGFLLNNQSYILLLLFLVLLILVPLFMLYSIGFFMYSYTRHSDYHFNFSKGCFQIVNNPTNTSELLSREFMILGLISYDKFIKKTLKMKIKYLDHITSLMSLYPTNKINNLAQNF